MLRLKLRESPRIPIEAPCITPDRLGPLTPAEISRLPAQRGNQTAALGDFFDVSGDAADQILEVRGDCSRVKWLGAVMTSGEMRIRGNVGMHAGSEMRGGRIEIHGDADDWLAAEMHDGLVHVRGRAGDRAGAAYPGSRRGMRGGVVLVDGVSGNGTAAVMRRGLMAVGASGDFAGASMIAGSLFVFGPLGKYAGAEMKRGTIAAFGPPPDLLPTFVPSCDYEPVFVELYLRRLRELGYKIPSLDKVSCRRYCGDSVSLGMGEILAINAL